MKCNEHRNKMHITKQGASNSTWQTKSPTLTCMWKWNLKVTIPNWVHVFLIPQVRTSDMLWNVLFLEYYIEQALDKNGWSTTEVSVAVSVVVVVVVVVVVTIRKIEKIFSYNFRIMSISQLWKLIHIQALYCTNFKNSTLVKSHYNKNLYVYRRVDFMTNLTVQIQDYGHMGWGTM